MGNVEKGIKYVSIFSIIIMIYVLINHIIGYYFGFITTISFPLNMKNILGTLSFQLFLSGLAEEILFRAVPISLLLFVFKRINIIKWGISLETIMASLLFSVAHIQWTLSPLTINFDYYQLIYSFILGIAYGKAYQDCNSILYPILMHSISNVIYVGVGYLVL